MSAAKTCFFGCAFPVLMVLILGTLFYTQAQEYTGTDIENKIATVRRKVARALDPKVKAVLQNNQPVPILMYHFIRDNVDEVADSLGYRLSVPEAEFRAQMSYLKQQGYTTINFDSFLSGHYPAKSVILTFDDGYRDFRDVAYPVLKQNGFTATTFVITGRLKDPNHLNATDVQFLAANGIEIGSHSVSHINLSNANRAKLRAELNDSRATLEQLINRPVVALNYPAGQYNDLTVEMAGRAGYEVAVTTNEGIASPNNMLTLPRVRIRRGISIAEFAALLQSH
ncbi:MAG: polysaccharide deacetylase family protein [bacterium]|nr:polysaccharide deacetylase family protein [bacterium]